MLRFAPTGLARILTTIATIQAETGSKVYRFLKEKPTKQNKQKPPEAV